MPFNFHQIQSVEFGVCLDTDDGESYRLMPCVAEVQEALEAGADVLLLDNMPVDTMRSAVELVRRVAPKVLIEASGSIGTNPAKLAAVAATGVDFISLGAITHSAPNFDVSLEFDRCI